MSRRTLPGFRGTLAFTWLYLGIVVLLPLSALILAASSLGWSGFVTTATSARALAAYKLSLGASGVATAINAIFGLLVAWVLVRYRFLGRAILDALVDLPFALPTAVAGLTLTSLYAKTGFLGKPLASLGIEVAFAPLGVVVALTFIGLPFVVRTVEPVLADLSVEVEEAAAVLGASRWQTFRKVVLPAVFPALLTGSSLAFARSIGEYGSIVFISGNLPMKTEIAPLLIVSKLEQYDYAGATALAVVMLGFSFLILLASNLVHRWSARRLGFEARMR